MAEKLTRKHRVLKYLMTHGSCTLPDIRKKHIGGDAADVRLRELRRDHHIEIPYYHKLDKHGKKTNTTVYWLKTPVYKIDFMNLRVIDA